LDADRAFHAVTLEVAGNAILPSFYSSPTVRCGIAEACATAIASGALQAVQTHLAGTVPAIGLAVDPCDR
jgi:hypothetical protein